MTNKLLNMYDESTYSDKYGLQILITFTLVFLVFCTVCYYYILNNLQPIKTQWPQKKCNPIYIPFAGVIHDKKGDEFYSFTANNFTGCIQDILSKISNTAFLPFYYMLSIFSNIYLIIINTIASIREILNKIKSSISAITLIIFNNMSNILTPIIEIFINIKSIIAKFAGAMVTIIYTLIATYYSLKTFIYSIVKFFTRVLWIIVAVIAALLLLGFFFPFALPAAISMGAVASLILGLVVILKIALSRTFKIHTSGLPRIPI